MKKIALGTLLTSSMIALALLMSAVTIFADCCDTGCSTASYSSFSSGSCLTSSSVPHASIVKWAPGSYGTFMSSHQKKPLPIWVTIAFDNAASEDFIKNYFQFLSVGNRGRDRRHSNEFIVTIPGTINRAEFESKINQANRRFDPEIERQEQRVIQEAKIKAEKEAADKVAAALEAQRRAEMLEAEKKAEAERKAIAAEEAAKILALQKQQEQIEAERAQKIIEQKEFLKESGFHSYSIIKLPTDFYIFGGCYAFNNNGQVVGCVSKKASTWQPIYKRGRRGNHCINAHEDKYEDAIAACWERRSGLRILDEKNNTAIAKAINDAGLAVISFGKKNEKKQTLLWNIATGNFQRGPIGDPYLITNNNIVLADEGSSSVIWNPVNNSILNDLRPKLYMTDTGELRDDRSLIMNRKGNSIKVATNLQLQCGSNKYLLLTEGDSRILAINDNDQVAALIDIKWGTKTFKAIQILDKYGNSLRSKVLKELEGCSHIWLLGFNIHGQVLLSTDKGYLFLDPSDTAKV